MGEIADGLLAADDGAVRAALGQELIRLQKAEPATALGVARDASADDVRARFLALVKLYHPNRFARRPRDVVRLANEVFLLLRRAAQRLGERPAAAAERAAPGTATTNGTHHHAGAAASSVASRASEISPPTQPRLEVDAALARRRRNRSQPVSSLSSAPPPSAVSTEMQEKLRRREEEQRDRFGAALTDLREGRIPSARATLRVLVAESPSSRPYRAHLHYVTGRMHESAGRTGEALAEYDRALGFDPDLELARRSRDGLTRSNTAPSAPDGTGRLGRWFRK